MNIINFAPRLKRRRSSSDFPTLRLVEIEIGDVKVEEREKVVAERSLGRQTELVTDVCTGRTEFRTMELIEKTIEKEVVQTNNRLQANPPLFLANN